MANPTRPLHAVLLVTMMLLLTATCVGQESSLRVLNDETEALQAQVDLIQQAECTIDVAYYALDSDQVPVAVIELLRQATLRGVRVRILVDGLKSRLPSKFERYLRRFGMELRVYHPPREGDPARLNRRLHVKLMVFDSDQAIIGSRNLENEHHHFDCSRKFTDCDALVAGEVARQSQAYFDWLWSTPNVMCAPNRDSIGLDILSYRPCRRTAWQEAWRNADEPADYQCLLNQAVEQVLCRSGIQLETNNNWMADAIHNVRMSLLHDCRCDKSDDHFQSGIVRMMDQAKCSLLIESPYPAFDPKIRAAISRASRRGVQVTILTNSLDSTDHISVYAAYQNQKRSLLREGVQLREYCGKHTLHAKTMLVDDSAWMLGSYNFDARSDNLNLELCIISCDQAGAAALRLNVQKRLAKSTLIASDSILLPVGHNATLLKRARMAMLRTIVELYRGVL